MQFLLPEDLREEEDAFEAEEEIGEKHDCIDDCIPGNPEKLGSFAVLFAMLGAVDAGGDRSQKKHNGKCNGDCANCPPRYGYRYGRRYYGHGHVHGCEFGGNKGSGGMD